jgi:succinate dehydrogenase/fumarate reductase-like Fe-S protein
MSKNPLYQALGNQQKNMMTDFQRFMQQMQGVNPYEEINKLLQSGKISQQQLNQAQQMAQQMQGMMGNFKR